jgi:hypothetical protein
VLEVDVGARIARNYVVFALLEYASLGAGDTLENEFGGQSRGSTQAIGLGMRFSSNPDNIGLLLELALGWRRFEANWESDTQLVASDDFFNTRIGIGMDIRLSRTLSLAPMLTVGGGLFDTIEWHFADGSKAGAFGELSATAPHTVATVQVGAHFDLFGSER